MIWLKKFWNHHISFHDINLWLGGAVYGIAVYLILVVLQPFGIDQMADNRYIMLLPFLFVTWIGCVIPSYVLSLIRKDFFYADKWTRGRLFLYLLSIVALITFGNLLCFVLIFGAPFSLRIIWTAIWQTITIAIMIFSIGLLLPEKKNKRKEIQEKLNDDFIIKGTGKNDSISIKISELLYVESAKNYCNIITANKNYNIRSTISSIEEQLSPFSQIKRCHRAYLVNINNILTIDGNSTSGYKIIMKIGINTIPLARQYTKIIKN